MNLTSCHVVPPSVVLYNPRSGFAAHACPSAATYTMLGLVGCTTMRPMAPLRSRPLGFQVSPPSVDLKMPQPGEMVLRESSSPVPAHTCRVSLGAMASSPMETHRWLSKTGRNDVPALVVFQIPPAAPAMKNVLEGLGIPTTLETRPPMLAGPMLRQRKPASRVESSGCVVCAAREGGSGGAATAVARTATAAHRRRVMTASCEESVEMKLCSKSDTRARGQSLRLTAPRGPRSAGTGAAAGVSPPARRRRPA